MKTAALTTALIFALILMGAVGLIAVVPLFLWNMTRRLWFRTLEAWVNHMEDQLTEMNEVGDE